MRYFRKSIVLFFLLLTMKSIYGQSDYTVAAFYYPWYSKSSNIHWPEGFLRKYLTPQQLPQLGLYDSFSSAAIDQHIQWSVNYGIDAWIVSWWGKQSNEDNCLNVFIKNRLVGTKLKFCIIYESGILPDWNWDNSTTRDRFKDDMIFIADKYFNHPNYFKIDNKPVIYVYVTRGFYGDHALGIQQTRQALAEKGYDVYFIADGIDANNSLKEYNALSLYLGLEVGDCMIRDGSYPYQNNCFEQIDATWSYMKLVAKRAGINFIPNISPGFNKDGWGSDPDQFWSCPPRVHPDSADISVLSKMCDIAIKNVDTTDRIVTVTSFNEWHEDTQIEPTVVTVETNKDTKEGRYSNGYYYKGYGTDRLEIIAKKFNKTITSADTIDKIISNSFTLSQNYPNPFNPVTTINFSLPKSAFVTLKIYNTLGQEITELVSQEMNPGTFSFEWNAAGLASGVYYYKITANEFVETKKLLLLK